MTDEQIAVYAACRATVDTRASLRSTVDGRGRVIVLATWPEPGIPTRSKRAFVEVPSIAERHPLDLTGKMAAEAATRLARMVGFA